MSENPTRDLVLEVEVEQGSARGQLIVGLTERVGANKAMTSVTPLLSRFGGRKEERKTR